LEVLECDYRLSCDSESTLANIFLMSSMLWSRLTRVDSSNCTLCSKFPLLGIKSKSLAMNDACLAGLGVEKSVHLKRGKHRLVPYAIKCVMIHPVSRTAHP